MKITNMEYLGDEIDVSSAFYTLGNTYFLASDLTDYDPERQSGTLNFLRMERKGRYSFVGCSAQFEKATSWAFPAVYPENPAFRIQFLFYAANIFRMFIVFDDNVPEEMESPILEPISEYTQVQVMQNENGAVLSTTEMSVHISFSPFRVTLKDKNGKLLTKTLNTTDSACLHNDKMIPLSFVQSYTTRSKQSAISFSLMPDEHFYGSGESFTRLDKTGQRLTLFTKDPHGSETREMYKPIPFYMSSRGYGVFTHTSTPCVFDFGSDYQEAQTIFAGENALDLFFITGDPKEVLTGYTTLTGKSPLPPLWSFGLWMSRITYRSEKEVREVINKLQENQIPCDVIHLDTGWFEEEWNCDYQFSYERFPDPQKMIQDLRQDGYRISLWQLPYFTPTNQLFKELCNNKLAVVNADGALPAEDAVLDFSNPQTVEWYQEKLKTLFQQGVSAIKADFGEAAPVSGAYHSGKSGFYEHNLYPLRYNKAVFDATKESTGEAVIWARSAWAGSQRYPIHWGGDTENTDMGMLSVLRGGLSLGMSGFSYWSHDIGGFVRQTPEELYRRWMFMGIFTSHMRCHGAAPKEPWAFSDSFLDLFRRQMQFRYRMMPYIFGQAIKCSKLGHPMMRAMFMEFPDDPGCYCIEDQYMFGDDILVAPLFTKIRERNVYLPEGEWIELFTRRVYKSGWSKIQAGDLEGIALVREGTVIPMVEVSLTTDMINWSTLQYYWYTLQKDKVRGTIVDYSKRRTVPATMEALKDDKIVVVEGNSI
ncbi:glycoside hydrolase family 31 protein [Lacrimispora sp.]|uniref:glycoside hydrolase family 31 protein n=1 Tax=Lacrimispora sp. TaxID=2719234 RepID=UPI0028A00AF2|nr:TIM-barrel domain-containing protein [Lacrimispora sp.]